jgi:hypothetical protein
MSVSDETLSDDVRFGQLALPPVATRQVGNCATPSNRCLTLEDPAQAGPIATTLDHSTMSKRCKACLALERCECLQVGQGLICLSARDTTPQACDEYSTLSPTSNVAACY